jgi:hypothetical protein
MYYYISENTLGSSKQILVSTSYKFLLSAVGKAGRIVGAVP